MSCIVCGAELKSTDNKFCSNECRISFKYSNANSYHRQLVKASVRKLRLINNRGGSCERCGYNKNISAIDFHHLRDKSFPLDSRNLANKKWKKILLEFEKCLVLCSNCHREEHNPESEYNVLMESVDIMAEDLNILDDLRQPNKCIDCSVEINNNAKRCVKCQTISMQKVDRPSLEQLLLDVSQTSYKATGRKYGVSDNAIRKWIKKYQKDLK